MQKWRKENENEEDESGKENSPVPSDGSYVDRWLEWGNFFAHSRGL